MSISIIVPVLNEALLIQPFLENLRERAAETEIIVVDGSSSDGTAQRAIGFCDRLVKTAPSRAKQMNAGASVARGEILWFLHADTSIPETALSDIERALQDRHVVGGFFRVWFPRQRFVYRLTDSFAHYAGLVLRIRCGDHAFFCRREVFEKIGGYPEVELMEDVDFFRKLRRAGRTAVVARSVVINPRRYEMIGPWRLTFAFGLIWLLYFLRVPRNILRLVYRRFCCRS